MSRFSDARDLLIAELSPVLGVPVYAGWPKNLSPPLAFTMPPEVGNYVEWGPNFSEVTAYTDLVLIVDHGDANAALEQLETMLDVVLSTVKTWLVRGVETPAPNTIAESGAEYLTVVVHLSKAVQV